MSDVSGRVCTPSDAATTDHATARGWQLRPRDDGRLDFVTADGTCHEDVDVRRGFPFTAPREGIAIVSAGGSELLWVESLAAIDRVLASRLEEVLAHREFMPVIDRIVSVSEGRPAEWNVVTDRGPHRFAVAHPDDVSRQPDGGLVLTDTNGIRYRIPVSAARDVRNRRLLDQAM